MIDKELLEKYSNLKTSQKAIEIELKEISPIIMGMMEGEGVDKLESDFGTFTIANKTTYTYSEKVTKLQEEEKANGTAKIKMSPYVLFKNKVSDED